MTAARLAAALELATAAHAGQVRKFDPVPYISHPVAVAALVRALGGDENQQIAALLHDVVEDTDVTLDQIRDQFGDDVATLVDAVTKRKHLGETYFEFVARSCAAGPRARLVKRADVLHNASTLPPDHGLHKRYTKTLALLDAAKETA